EPFRITPDRAYHGRPGTLDRQETALAALDFFARLVDDSGLDARQRQSARARFQRRDARQRIDHVPAGFRLPPGVDHRAALTPDISEIPHPGFRVDRLAHRTDDPKAAQVVFARMVLRRRFGRL